MEEMNEIIKCLDRTDKALSTEINAEKTKVMTSNAEGITGDIRINDKRLETVNQFKYLGTTVTYEGPNPRNPVKDSTRNTCNVPTEDHIERQKHISPEKNKADAHTFFYQVLSMHAKHGPSLMICKNEFRPWR